MPEIVAGRHVCNGKVARSRSAMSSDMKIRRSRFTLYQHFGIADIARLVA